MKSIINTLRRISPRHRAEERIGANLAKNLVEDPILRVSEFMGNFQLAPNSRLFFRLAVHGTYEPKIVALVRRHLDPNRDVIDVGANIGFFTTLFAKIAVERRVLAIEPTPAALGRLLANLKRNGIVDRVLLYEGVASECEGTVALSTIEGQEEFSSLGEITHPSADGKNQSRIEVRSQTLDELVRQYDLDVGFLKIDTEGAEQLVLNGCVETLKKHRPIVVSELSDPLLRAKDSSAESVVGFLRDFDYDVSDPNYPDLEPGSRPFGDILAIPR